MTCPISFKWHASRNVIFSKYFLDMSSTDVSCSIQYVTIDLEWYEDEMLVNACCWQARRQIKTQNGVYFHPSSHIWYDASSDKCRMNMKLYSASKLYEWTSLLQIFVDKATVTNRLCHTMLTCNAWVIFTVVQCVLCAVSAYYCSSSGRRQKACVRKLW